MRKTLAGIGAVALAAAAITFGGTAIATQPDSNGNLENGPYVEAGHKVTICHRTGSESNPYVVITVDVAAIDGVGSSDHDGHDQTGNGPIGDVIPPVEGYNDHGKNWLGNWEPGDDVTPDKCYATPPSPSPSPSQSPS